jgi:hypothetical protein
VIGFILMFAVSISRFVCCCLLMSLIKKFFHKNFLRRYNVVKVISLISKTLKKFDRQIPNKLE